MQVVAKNIPLKIFPNKNFRIKHIFSMILSTFFIIFSVFTLQMTGVFGWAGVLFGFFGFFVCFFQLLPGSCFIQIQPDFFVLSNFFIKKKVSWNEIEEFYIPGYGLDELYVPGQPLPNKWDFICLRFSRHTDQYKKNSKYKLEGTVRTLGHNPEHLVDMLNSYLRYFRD